VSDITVNGERRQVPEGTTLADLVRSLGADPTGCAVAANGEVVPRSDWSDRAVGVGDAVEVLTAVQGG
jgi:sulfur carrier protein